MPTTHTPSPTAKAALTALVSLDRGEPFNTTFLFCEPGCAAVGQGTPLAKAIEEAMARKFRIWEQSWIRPKLEEIAEDTTAQELLEALIYAREEIALRVVEDGGTKYSIEKACRKLDAAIAKAKGR